LAEAARLAKLEKGNWHPLYIEPVPDFASTLLGGLMPEPAQAHMPTDLFGRAAFEQQLLFDRIAADLRLLSGVQGAQVRCLECGVVAGVPTQPEGGLNKGWLELFIRHIR
jgi:protease-4